MDKQNKTKNPIEEAAERGALPGWIKVLKALLENAEMLKASAPKSKDDPRPGEKNEK